MNKPDPRIERIELEIHPDPNELDKEWCNQPRLRFRYGQELADARRGLATAKAELEVSEAELDLAVRSDPGKYGLEKVTEAAVKSTVPTLKQYQKAKRAVIDAQYAVDVLDAAVSSIDHRKKALEDLVQLFMMDYYSKPKAPEGARERMEEVGKANVRRRGRDRQEEE
jgi:hypothetical protein